VLPVLNPDSEVEGDLRITHRRHGEASTGKPPWSFFALFGPLRLKLFHLQGSKISKFLKEIFGITAWNRSFNFGTAVNASLRRSTGQAFSFPDPDSDPTRSWAFY